MSLQFVATKKTPMEVDAVHEMEEIPCFTRKDFLKKIGIAKSAFTQVTTPLQTKEGFTFFVNVINEQDTTYFTGRDYRKVRCLTSPMKQALSRLFWIPL
ncbi:uncharacterized protein LOC119352241 isoform X2 [Triticum dicoccoides]|uniref:uncharacterized protein LOC119352241 isoform X2 n=1 Tax=Triticum dicoccoides TaxID=85692 RepID=UPI00188FAFAD|nr:uncharacterized protein LOC119352241 isoform X2 [Triticum dicoccoides]